ncbi:MAG: hypothetical protein ACFCGT_12085 [Sandaracinaceae bacterium]
MGRHLVLSGALLLLAPHLGLAQGAPDVVVLRDGGMLRGTIVESVPGERVTILLPTGESRIVSWSRVTFAGPEDERPQVDRDLAPPLADPPAVTLPPPVLHGVAPRQGRGPRIPIVVESRQRYVELWAEVGAIPQTGVGHRLRETVDEVAFERVCSVPCGLGLTVGTYRLALTRLRQVVPAPPIDLEAGGTLDVWYRDRRGVRALGWVLGPVGMSGGVVMLGYGLFLFGFAPPSDTVLLLSAGTALLATSLIVWIALAALQDGAVLRFVPAAPGLR